MMKQQKMICAIGMLAVACTIVSIAAIDEKSVQTEAESVVKECSLLESYRVGETLAVENAVLTYNGQDYISNGFVITYPSLLSKSGADSYVLSEVGQYEVAYTYDSDLLKIKGVKTFDVLDSVYSFTAQGGLEFTQLSSGNGTGLSLTYSSGDVFTYNQPIDLNETTRLCTLNILQDCFAPQAAIVNVTLTDAYDAAKYVNVVLYYSEEFDSIYGRAGATKQDETACVPCPESQDYSWRKYFYIDGQRYYARINQNGIELGVNNRFTVYYDDSCGDVYLESMTKNVFITNVYNGDINAEIFEGFTTGEVLLSVSVEEFTASTLGVEIIELDGAMGEQLQERLYQDSVVPKIELACPKDTLRIAKGESVPVFDYSVVDASYTGESQVCCYYDYERD